MEDLLTTRQVRDMLKVDRTTIYRMVEDGRLAGVKVGNQWRFPRQKVEALLGLDTAVPLDVNISDPQPISCIQTIQDVCAELAEIGAVTVDATGKPLTQVSNCSRFCQLIQSRKSGRQACANSWKLLSEQPANVSQSVTCHAGLQYARVPMKLDGRTNALLVAGQFFIYKPASDVMAGRIKQLSQTYDIDETELTEAAQELLVLDDRKQREIGRWLQKVAHTFEMVSQERAELIGRLRRIAAMSAIE